MEKDTFIEMQYQDPKCPRDITVGDYIRKNNKIFLPERMLSLVCLCLHKERNHPGAQGLFKIIKSLYYVDRFAGLQKICQAIANNCTVCLLNKPGNSRYHTGGVREDYNNRANTVIAVDLIELPTIQSRVKSDLSCNALLVITDLYSKYITVYFVPNKKSGPLIRCMANYFGTHGISEKIISDRGALFISRSFRTFCKRLGCQFLESSPLHKESKGFAEIRNRMLNEAIRKDNTPNHQIDYISSLAKTVSILNRVPFKNSDLCPYTMQFESVKYLDNTLMISTSMYSHQNMSSLTSYDDLLKDKKEMIDQQCAKQHKQFMKDKRELLAKRNKHKYPHSFKIGDYVLCKKFHGAGVYYAKFRNQFYVNLFKIKRVNKFVVHCECLVTGQVITRHIQHIKKLKTDTLKALQLPPEILTQFGLISANLENNLVLHRPKLNVLVGPKTRSQNLLKEDSEPEVDENMEKYDFDEENAKLEGLQIIFEDEENDNESENETNI